jgi:hypothetical protein
MKKEYLEHIWMKIPCEASRRRKQPKEARNRLGAQAEPKARQTEEEASRRKEDS